MENKFQLKPKSIFWFVITLFLTVAFIGSAFVVFGNVILMLFVSEFAISSFIYHILFFAVAVAGYLAALRIAISYIVKNGLLGKKEFKQVLWLVLFLNLVVYLYSNGIDPDYISVLGTGVLFVILYWGGVHFFDKKRLEVMRLQGYEEKDIPNLNIFTRGDFAIFLLLLLVTAVFLYLTNQISLVDIGARFIDSNRGSPMYQNGAQEQGKNKQSWEVYRNDEYGFELRYPAHLSFLDISDSQFFDEEDNSNGFEFIIYDGKYVPSEGAMGQEVRLTHQLVRFFVQKYSPRLLEEMKSIEEDLREKVVSTGRDPEDILPRKEKIGNYEMVYYEQLGAAGPYPNIYFYTDRYFIRAESWQKNLMKEILSTFKFTESQELIDTSGRGTTRDDKEVLQTCDKNSCALGFVCWSGTIRPCGPPKPGDELCGDIPTGDGLCHKDCTADVDCPSGFICEQTGNFGGDVGDFIKICL